MFIVTELNILDFLKMAKDMETVKIYGQMVQLIKEIGKITKLMEKGYFTI